MSGDPGWLKSRHLERSPEGRLALAELEGLEQHRRLLATGTVLAGHSVALAHRYLIAAVALLSAGRGAKTFEAWEEAGLNILGDDGSGREAAAVFFEFDPATLSASGDDTFQTWAAASAELTRQSRRLGAGFAKVTGPALCHGRVDREQVEAWSRAVIRLYGKGGWRAETAANSLLDSAAKWICLLTPQSVAEWAAIVDLFSRRGRKGGLTLPDSLAKLDDAMQVEVLSICAAVAAANIGRTRDFLSGLPGATAATAAISTVAAERLLKALASALEVEGLAEALELLPAVVHELGAAGRAQLEAAMARLTVIAASFAPGVVPFLRTMDRALEEGGLEGMDLWVERGIAVGCNNVAAGLAHFRLESRTARKILTSLSTAVSFEEIEGPMQRYLQMMARGPFQMAQSAGLWLRPPLGSGEDAVLRLPQRIDIFPTSEENQLLYKLTVAHEAGRWEYGTYALRPSLMKERGVELPPENSDSEPRDDVVGLLSCFADPLVATALFVLFDGARIDARLKADFPGLAADIEQMGPRYAASAPPSAAERSGQVLLESLFLMSVGSLAAANLPHRLRPQGFALEPALALLASRDADVYDSARLTLAFYSALVSTPPPADLDGEVLPNAGGATVIDPFEHLDGSGSIGAGAPAGPTCEGRNKEEIGAEGTLQLGDKVAEAGGGRPLSAEELSRLLESGAAEITQQQGEVESELGLYITDLLGKLPQQQIERLRQLLSSGDSSGVRAWLAEQATARFYYYDEWDHRIGDYRHRWCRLSEATPPGDGGVYFARAAARSRDLISSIRREFQLMTPQALRKVRGMDDGEELDLNALVDAHADRAVRRPSSERVYLARRREERDVATLFLVDMSASTDEPVGESIESENPRRVIDVAKDTLVVMCEALEDMGDAYAIFGFSGHGRDNVEYYHIKSFAEALGFGAKERLGGMEPKRSTRMGAALRHSAAKLARVSARARHLILLSDGFPQDFDYGEDRRSNAYGIADTMMALREIESASVHSFCITVDPAGHDYLRDMCPAARYAVIDDIASLPEELPRIYRNLTHR